MGLFDKKTKKCGERCGNIPEGLGIKQDRANEIIDAVRSQYGEAHGNVNKVFDLIKAEKLNENESTFAYYVVGAVKTMEGRDMMPEMDEMLANLKRLRDLVEEK